MTDQEYLEKMITITDDLDRIASDGHFRGLEWNSKIDEMHKVTCDWHAARLRRPRFFAYIWWFLLGFIIAVILHISC